MALTDNLVVRVQPASGDTYVKNLITVEDVAASGAGTLTLVDDAGLYGWQVQGARNGNFTGGATYEGGAITVAVRFKANSRAADFAQYLAVGTATSSFFGAQITNNGTSTGALRLRESIAGSGFTAIGTPAYTTGQYFTVVLRLHDSTFGAGTLAAFLDQASRSSNDPDYSVSAASANRAGTVDDIVLGATSQNVTFVDLAVWTRALTDAEAAAVADDIRGQLAGGVNSFEYVPSGGLSFSGVAAQIRERIAAVAGGIQFAGTSAFESTALQSLTVAPSGGIGFGGTAVVVRSLIRAVAGGFSIAGTAAVEFGSAIAARLNWLIHARRRGRR